jgi:hypothetical protein
MIQIAGYCTQLQCCGVVMCGALDYLFVKYMKIPEFRALEL